MDYIEHYYVFANHTVFVCIQWSFMFHAYVKQANCGSKYPGIYMNIHRETN